MFSRRSSEANNRRLSDESRYAHAEGAPSTGAASTTEWPNSLSRAEWTKRCIRKIRMCPILSNEWLAMVDNIEHLGRMAMLESFVSNDSLDERKGRSAEGTLWDQSCCEDAIRLLVEEAKVTLCVRMLCELKSWQYSQGDASAFAERYKNDAAERKKLENKLTVYEESLGRLLQRAFLHVETLQLTDVGVVLRHIKTVLSSVLNREQLHVLDNIRLQEFVVIHYFFSLMKFLERLNEQEIVPTLLELEIPSLIAAHAVKFADSYSAELKTSVVEGLTYMFESEDVRAQFPRNVTPACRQNFLALQDLLLRDPHFSSPASCREHRPLYEMMKRMQLQSA